MNVKAGVISELRSDNPKVKPCGLGRCAALSTPKPEGLHLPYLRAQPGGKRGAPGGRKAPLGKRRPQPEERRENIIEQVSLIRRSSSCSKALFDRHLIHVLILHLLQHHKHHRHHDEREEEGEYHTVDNCYRHRLPKRYVVAA